MLGCPKVTKSKIKCQDYSRQSYKEKENVKWKLYITLSNGIYVDMVNIQPRIQNQLRRMTAFNNL